MLDLPFQRPALEVLLRRLTEPLARIVAIVGPRQVGKTTLALQAARALDTAWHLASADDPLARDAVWLRAQWEAGRDLTTETGEALLILDEIHTVPGWSDIAKAEWDRDRARGIRLRVLVLGSSPLLLTQGLANSLAGRFEVLHLRQWSFSEMREAFGFDVDRYVLYGGYPGAAPLADDMDRWRRYILDALIESTVARDVLQLTRIHKPALLRQLFQLGMEYSSQVLSFTKMLGRLSDAGNTTTLAHYLDLLSQAGMLSGLEKYSGGAVRRRSSSPKLLALDTGLVTAVTGLPSTTRQDHPDLWGRLVETAVGATLVHAGVPSAWRVGYWREGNDEVDFIVEASRRIIAIEVKSGRGGSVAGLGQFTRRYPEARPLIVGGDGIPLERFLSETTQIVTET